MRLIGLIVLFMLAGWPQAQAAEADGVWPAYSIELRPVPFSAAAEGLAELERLTAKGYLAYAYRFEFDEKSWLHVAVGAFAEREAAIDFRRQFAAAEGVDASIVEAPVRIVPGRGGEFVITPTALWARDGSGSRIVYEFGAEAFYWKPLAEVILARLSPDGGSLAFVYDKGVHVASLDRDDVVSLTDGRSPLVSPVGDYPWQPSWSPSGRHVVFLDRAVFNQPIGLWMVGRDGGDLRCLSCDPSGVAAVRWFLWHPTEDRLLFVRTTRSSAVGGELLSVALDGVIEPVPAVTLDVQEEIVGPLTIEDGHLRYKRLWSVDEQYSQHTVTREQVPIDAL